MTLKSPGVLKTLQCCLLSFKRGMRKNKGSALGHFFPLNVYVNSLALGGKKSRASEECVSLATNISKSHQTPTPTHARTNMQLTPLPTPLPSPPPLQRPSWRLGKKMAALWPPVLPLASSSGR